MKEFQGRSKSLKNQQILALEILKIKY
ncbi:DUF536 domain-containing protein [Staphylococcus epidermidis]|nr:DUF536 domain-containing protein [Staphylococcus epidermidis]MBC2923435.1 DUF536 domain-containing protein [Staphylococcus epidermidis]MBC2924888.1 DUF536 domain-containing protein [Staphylococcus epidermidis]MBC2927737.1 DUF536 domain-containing protein [Staphylococcus epidermidis]MBC2938887.1 DUF536 domain-containing protein [Staphylococcus epidermidis]